MIWIDLDNTLIYVSDPRENRMFAAFAPGYGLDPAVFLRPPPRKGRRMLRRINVKGVEVSGCLRNGALEFLAALRKLGEVRMLTAATKAYALAMNKEFKLGFKKRQICAREEWRGGLLSTPPFNVDKEGVFVDNKSDYGNLMPKLSYLGADPRLVTVPNFWGFVDDSFAEEWPSYVEAVKKLLQETLAETRARHKAEMEAMQAMQANIQPSVSPMAMLLEQEAIAQRRKAKQRLRNQAAKAARQKAKQA